MTNYAYTATLISGDETTIAANVTAFINAIANTKVIHNIVLARSGAGNCSVLIVMDT